MHIPVPPGGRCAPVRARAGLAASLALAFALAALVLLFPAVAARAADPPVPISAGYADWGLKQSFRTYVGASGITLADGATRTPTAASASR